MWIHKMNLSPATPGERDEGKILLSGFLLIAASISLTDEHVQNGRFFIKMRSFLGVDPLWAMERLQIQERRLSPCLYVWYKLLSSSFTIKK